MPHEAARTRFPLPQGIAGRRTDPACSMLPVPLEASDCRMPEDGAGLTDAGLPISSVLWDGRPSPPTRHLYVMTVIPVLGNRARLGSGKQRSGILGAMGCRVAWRRNMPSPRRSRDVES